MRATCSKCGTEKDASEFSVRPSGTLQSHCKECKNAWAKEYRKTTESKRYKKDYQLQYTYGITLDDFEDMLKAQDNSCAICKNEFNPTDTAYQGAYVDHCHETGVVRGLLCHNCNFAIGYMKDNPQRLRAAANYLEVTLSTT